MRIEEFEGKVIFLHQVIPGNADRSYGVHVAALAGLPMTVVERATELLKVFEQQAQQSDRQLKIPLAPLPFVKAALQESKIDQELKKIDLDQLTPREALDFLYRLKQQVGKS